MLGWVKGSKEAKKDAVEGPGVSEVYRPEYVFPLLLPALSSLHPDCFGPGSQLPDSAPGLASPPTSLWALSSGSSGLGSSCPQPPPTDTRGHYSLNWSVPSGCAGSPQSSWPLKVACSNHTNHLKFPSLFGHHGRLPRDWLQSPQGLPKGLGQILLLI